MISTNDIVHEMGGALLRQEGAYFLGSGISAASGLPDWLGLIQRIAKPLELTVTSKDDLPQIAQFCVNHDNGNRGPLVGKMKRTLSATPDRHNKYHLAIGRTNVSVIWTTNFDTLLERNLPMTRLAVRANDADLTSGTRSFEIELLKIHGCIDRSAPQDFVLTQEDYEEFGVRKPALAQRLRHDLIHRSLLFIGYSYRDPNIATAIVEARRLSRGSTREHFLVAKKEKKPGDARRQSLWLSDLRRFGIRSALITSFDELANMLDHLALASRGRSVFVTGSHAGSCELASELGKRLVSSDRVVLLDGQSSGIGHAVSNAFGAECVAQKMDIRERIRFFPNPYTFCPELANDPSLLGTLKGWRSSLARAAHTAIVFDGGMGTDAEVEVARAMGCIIVPVPTSHDGTAARLLADADVVNRLPAPYVKLAKARAVAAEDIVECVEGTFSR